MLIIGKPLNGRVGQNRRAYHRVLKQVLQFAQSAVAVTCVLSLDGVLQLTQVRLTVPHLTHELRIHAHSKRETNRELTIIRPNHMMYSKFCFWYQDTMVLKG